MSALAFGIKETTGTAGTGNLTLTGVTGFPRFSDKFPFAGARRFEYAIVDSTGAPLENGIGYMITDTNTMVREKILATYVSSVYNDLTPTAVTLAGTNTVICTYGSGNGAMVAQNIDTASTTNTPRRATYNELLSYVNASSSAFTMVANTLYMMPFKLAQSVIATGLLTRVGTAAAGKNVRLGLYEIGSSGYPTRLLGDSGDISVATAPLDLSGSFLTGNIKLSAGYYCVAMMSDGVPAMGAITSQAPASFFGGDTTNALILTHYRSATQTYGAMPNPPPTASSRISTATTAHPFIAITVL